MKNNSYYLSITHGNSLNHVEKVNIDAELVNLNNAEKQTGSFKFLMLLFSLFFPLLNRSGFYFVSQWFKYWV